MAKGFFIIIIILFIHTYANTPRSHHPLFHCENRRRRRRILNDMMMDTVVLLQQQQPGLYSVGFSSQYSNHIPYLHNIINCKNIIRRSGNTALTQYAFICDAKSACSGCSRTGSVVVSCSQGSRKGRRLLASSSSSSPSPPPPAGGGGGEEGSEDGRWVSSGVAMLEIAAAAVSVNLTVGGVGSAEALTSEEVADTFSKVQLFTQEATGYVITTYVTVKEVLEKIFTALRPAVDVAVPYVQKATDAAIKASAPVASDVARQADRALQSIGVDTQPVIDVAKTAVTVAEEAAENTTKVLEGASPVAASTLESLLSSDPFILVGGAGGLVLLYIFAPFIGSSITFAVRGYKGNLTAAQALDLLSKEDYTLIDIRTEKEKANSGVPSLPKNVKNKFLSIPLEELPSKLKSQLRNARKVEAEIAAIKISSLKKINQRSKIVILDGIGDVGKLVAKSLTDLGFKNTWTIVDGFDGGRGWVQSKLGTETSKLSFSEILSPTRIIPAPSSTKKLFSNRSSDIIDSTSRRNRLLPSGSSDD